MQITILAIGTRGDVQPYIALALGLRKAGHQIRIAAGANYESFIREYGFDFLPVGGDLRDVMDSEAMRRTLEKSSLLHYWRDFVEALRDAFERFAEGAWAASQGSDAIIFSTIAVSGYGFAQKLDVPCFWAPLQPMSRTREFPSVFVPQKSLGGSVNWFSHLAEEQMAWQPFRQFINHWRHDILGIQPFPFKGPFDLIVETKLPTLYGYSPNVLPKPKDWGDWIHVTGYWFLDHDRDWQPPAKLIDFIKAGAPPVYIGFGSMTNRKPQEVTALVVKALSIAKQRGVLVTGWGGLNGIDLPDSIFQIDAVPHDWLFPQMAAVVHHGGAGTTGAGLRAGVPSIITPFSVDQPFWAQRAFDLGVGTKPIPRQRLTAELLADAITLAINDREMRTRAATLGEQIRMENGVECAVQAIESHVREFRNGH